MAVAKKDEYAQMGYLTVTESAANTLTFAGLSVFSNVLSNQAMIIHKIKYLLPAASIALLTASSDFFTFGLAGSDSMTSVALDDPEVYDYNNVVRFDMGAAADGELVSNPVEIDYSDLPGGGLMVPADRLYLFAQGNSLASAGSVTCRFYYTIKPLKADQYLELAQSLRVLR